MTGALPPLPLIFCMARTRKISPFFYIYPNKAAPFVDRNLWRYIEGGAKCEYRIIRNLCSWAVSECGYIYIGGE